MKPLNKQRAISLIIVIGCIALATAGCANQARTGAVGGAGLGALAGQAIGRDTAGTLIGAGVGLGLGYIIGNEMDKEKATTKNQSTPPTEYRHSEVGPLGGTRWKVTSVNPQGAWGTYTSKVVEFGPTGRLMVTTTNTDGSVDVTNEHYRVVGNTLIVNRPGYLVNGRYAIQEGQLIVDIEKSSIMLQRLN